jgi:hypothetical protein
VRSEAPIAPVTRAHLFAAVLLFAVLTAAFTWPQVVEPAGIVPHRDSWFNMWRLGWVAHQLPSDPRHLFDANIYYPERGTLAYSDAVLLPAVMAAPFIHVGLPLPYVHTLLVLASFVFAGVSMWTLVRALTGSAAAGLAAGIVFAFTPFRFDHYMHLELLWTGWMPLGLLAIHRAIDGGRVRAGVAAGLLFAAQALSSIYYAVLFGAVLVPIVVVLLVRLPRARVRRAVLALAGAAVVSAAILVPYMRPYVVARQAVGERSQDEAQLYSAGPSHYLAPAPGSVLYAPLAERFGRDEKRLFPGFVALALAALALWPPWSRLRVAFGLALLLAVDLSFGPSGLTFDWLRDYVLAFRGLRAPARAGAVTLLFVAALAGLGWARLQARLSGRRGRWLSAGALALMLLEYAAAPLSLVAAPLRTPDVYAWLAAQPHGAVAEYPWPDGHRFPGHDPVFAYFSTMHWKPLVNGYSGNVPDAYVSLLRDIQSFPGEDALGRLRRAGVRYVIVHEHLTGSERYRAIAGALDARSDVRAHGPFGPAGHASRVYELAPSHD